MILHCGCVAGPSGVKAGTIYQDGKYGSGNRAHTPTAKENTFRCTICLKERSKSGAKAEEDPKSPKKADEKLAKSKK